MNPNDYDFWSVGNEQLSLQNHFPKHIPKISLLSHSGADSPTDSNSVNNNYTCAEPEILRRSLESAIQSAHDEIEKYQFTLNANTAKKLLEATAQGAFRDDPNIQNSQNNHYQQQQQSRNYKKSKLRLMELFIPPIQEEEACELSSTPQNQSRRESEETNKNILKNSSSYKMEKRNSTPSILSSSMFQPPTPSENKKPPLYMNNSQKPPIVPNKKNENKYGEEDEEEEELQNKIISDNTNTKNNTDNEQSVTTIKSNVNDELLQLLNKYYPTKNKSQQNLNTDDEISSVEDSSERVYKSDGNIKVSNGSVISEGYKSSSESSSDTEKENIMEDSFLPSNANKKPHKSSNENVDHSNENNDKHSHSTLNDTSKEHSKTESQPSQSSKSKLRKKSKKHKLKEIFLPIQRIFNNNSNQNSSKKTKSNENIHKDSQSESYANDTNEDESKYRCEEVLGKGAVSI
ncbi:hypothetical protein BCR36DRAFT_138496 [Piromyces finnis]|uniref:Uncharacterized protein n=1 Tax=Piromyces finnis TaxID=1754191 RepID=A0A1Y1VK57_9FUNG|nr:hypothetical protein BCR36DRAFT_138496 [Piromyces finnis]|eukprot:ORX57885.1 hypothetical protein BCR36DRAFT_138496 [Piromyces finnis]